MRLALLPASAPRVCRWTLLVSIALGLGGCGGPRDYVYHYVPGRSATLAEDGSAVAPSRAPRAVRAAIEAGNLIAGSPYVYGGGHGDNDRGGYDCSGATSYVLRSVGRLRGSLDSEGFRRYGEGGEGDWISVYARHGHAFLVVAGLRFDTGWNGGGRDSGVRWTRRSRTTDGCVVRHPSGL